ncbi:UDP-N-acetylglucosamine:LPS N-acetylglucosamine transferase [Streptacidiphilus sp. MAP12-33]
MGRLIRLPLQRRTVPGHGTPRAVIVSASVGAGHDAVAKELEVRLLEAGLTVDRHDFLDLLPGTTGKIFVGTYHTMLERAPWTWKLLYGGMDNPGMMSGQARLFTWLAGRAMRRALKDDTAIVVSTYPLASQVLGRLRKSGKVSQRVHTYLTDFSVHRLWASPHVDAHLAVHTVPAEQAESVDCQDVHVVTPLVDRRFQPVSKASRVAARQRWGLPHDRKIALLVGGSWGAGDLEHTVADVQAADPRFTCVVVCGRNEVLRQRLEAAGVTALGWVDDMPSLMHAADVLVQNAGGITVLEAVASGIPVVTYRSIPGHGLTNAAALDAAGVAPWARTHAELAPLLDRAIRSESAVPAPWGVDPVGLLLESAGLGHLAAAAPGVVLPLGAAREAMDSMEMEKAR